MELREVVSSAQRFPISRTDETGRSRAAAATPAIPTNDGVTRAIDALGRSILGAV